MDQMALKEALEKSGFKVNDIFEGSDGVQNNVPQIIFEVPNEIELEPQEDKMKTIIASFYENNQADPKNKIKLTTIQGMGEQKSLPKFGFVLYSGTLDDMESDTGIEKFDAYNQEHQNALSQVLSDHRKELENFAEFVIKINHA